jgi:RNA polymerase sigma factor (sigma-70 family)
MNEAGAAERPEDAELVEAFLGSGDEAAFRELYRRHTPALYAFAMRFVGGAGRGAEDVVQETWLRAFDALRRFGGRSALRTWLVGIAINCAREALRRRRRGLPFEVPERDEPAPDPAVRMDLEEAIRSLPDGYRAVLVLHDVEGMTHAEIGERLGIEPGTSKSQLSRARRALRARWNGGNRPGGGPS